MVTPKRGSQSEILATQAARDLSERIIAGEMRAGTPLREVALSEELGVSRNTLREAFRELLSQGLIEHQMYRGATVKVLNPGEVREVYTIRRTLEVKGIEESAFATPEKLREMALCVADGEAAVDLNRWDEAFTHSLRFHRTIVSMINSPRLDNFFQIICAQLRLAFSPTVNDESFQRPWIARDHELCRLISTGRRIEAIRAALSYLDDSERTVMDRMRLRGPDTSDGHRRMARVES
jgi:DNA-binding GntR family transcriptional regulator